MDLGNKIQQLRKQNNLTQLDLAEKLNVSPQAVSKWENGQSEPDFATLNKICKIFNVSISNFSEENNAMNNNEDRKTEDEKQIEKIVETKIINGYCEKCNKPVGPGEYKVENVRAGAKSSIMNQHIYCNDCYKKLQAERRAKRIREAKSDFIKGIVWGAIAAVASIIILIILELGVLASIAVGIVLFLFITQERWDVGVASDVFDFFTRTFRAPFGFIFDLSLDGIIWLLTVKLVLWIICAILSILWFLIGLVIIIPVTVIGWPFALVAKIREFR